MGRPLSCISKVGFQLEKQADRLHVEGVVTTSTTFKRTCRTIKNLDETSVKLLEKLMNLKQKFNEEGKMQNKKENGHRESKYIYIYHC